MKRDGNDWAITGDLTIKDVTKSVTIDFEQTGSAQDPFGNVRVGFEGETTINRKDWGLTWNAALETGGVLVSDKISSSSTSRRSATPEHRPGPHGPTVEEPRQPPAGGVLRDLTLVRTSTPPS